MGKRNIEVDLQIVDSKPALAAAAAEAFVRAAQSAVSSRGRFLVALSGGSTPQALFSLLAAAPYHARIDWPAVYVFWGDERMVGADDPGSNYFHARRLLLDYIPVPADQIYRMRGELPVDDAITDYERLLLAAAPGDRTWPKFDLALMGLGADGHTASLFPGSNAIYEEKKPVVAVTAEYAGRPAKRLTITAPVFNDSRQVLFLVAGKDKACALAKVIQGSGTVAQLPAQLIQPNSGQLTWIVDQDAASMLSGS
jgi:6-phosphogluconolactonase